MTKQRKALGKGLDALLKNDSDEQNSTSFETRYKAGNISRIALNKIIPNTHQPRTEFDEELLKELSFSISEYGIIQPITVRETENNKFEIISGERRWRASKLAGLNDIPAYVRLTNDEDMLQLALVENIQREDLNPIEIAISYQRLLDECNFSQEKLSAKLGKSRSVITNSIRLLRLPAEIQKALKEHNISNGHARTLLSFDNKEKQIEVFKKIMTENLTVRDVELITKEKKESKQSKMQDNVLPQSYRITNELLNKELNTKVKIKRSIRGKGSISINFSSDKEFERIIEFIRKSE